MGMGCISEREKAWFEARTRDSSSIDQETILIAPEEVMDNYEKHVIQFGYLALFAPAFHLSSFLAFVKNVYELRADAYSEW